MLISLTHNSSTKCLGEPFSNWTTCFLPAELGSHCILNTILWWKYIVKIFPAILWFVFFILLIVSFTEQAFYSWWNILFFMDCALMSWQKSFCPTLGPEDFFFSKRFIVLNFTLGCMVHFAIFLEFLYKVWNLGQDSVICLGISNFP